MMTSTTVPLDAQTRRRIAAAAACDDRSILRFLRRQPVRPSTVARIRRAAADLGIVLPEPVPVIAATDHEDAARTGCRPKSAALRPQRQAIADAED